jgi:predicted TIM-barrel fold metal-dependent hydrolase
LSTDLSTPVDIGQKEPSLPTPATEPLVIDIHTVFGPWPGALADTSLTSLLDILEKNQISQAFCASTVGILIDSEAGNELTAETCSNNVRLLAAGTVNPAATPNAGEVVDKAVESGIRLFFLYPESQGWQPDSLHGAALFAKLAEKDCAVLVEASTPGTATKLARVAGELDMPLIMCGADMDTLVEALAAAEAAARFGLCSHSLVAADALELAVSRLGAERIYFGSLSPVLYCSPSLLRVKYADLQEHEKQAILGANARRFTKDG